MPRKLPTRKSRRARPSAKEQLAKAKAEARRDRNEARDRAFLALLDEHGIERPVTEHRFDAVRKFRMDFAWPERKVYLEVQGGIWKRGKSGHSSGTGIRRDMTKITLATTHGWRPILAEPEELKTEALIETIRKALEADQK